MKELLRSIAAIALSALVLLGAAAALRPVAERNRAAEREAMMAERDVDDLKKCEYMMQFVGQKERTRTSGPSMGRMRAM